MEAQQGYRLQKTKSARRPTGQTTQSYVGCNLHVNKRGNRSKLFQMKATAFADVMGESGS